MPIIKSAIKRAKQTIVRRERNVAMKHDIKAANKAFAAKPSAKTLSETVSAIDTAVKKGLLKKNTAARRKARLSRLSKAAGVKLATTKKAVATEKPKTVAKKAAPKKAAAKATAKKPAAKKTAKA